MSNQKRSLLSSNEGPMRRRLPSSAFLFLNILFISIYLIIFSFSVYEFCTIVGKSVGSYNAQMGFMRLNSLLFNLYKEMESLTNNKTIGLRDIEQLHKEYEKIKIDFIAFRDLMNATKGSADSVDNIVILNFQELLNDFYKQIDYSSGRAENNIKSFIDTWSKEKEHRLKVISELNESMLLFYQKLYDKEVDYNRRIARAQLLLFIMWVVLIIYSLLLLFFFIRNRRKSLSELRKFYAFIEHSADPLQLTDSKGITKYVNQAFINWSGRQKDSIVGQYAFDYIENSLSRVDVKAIWELAIPFLSNGKAWIGEIDFEDSFGHRKYSNVIISPVMDANGQLEECIIMYNDQTELKEYARKIVETQRRYESIVESSLDSIVVSQNNNIVYVNPSAVRLFGYASQEEMQKLKLSDIIVMQSKFLANVEQEPYVIGEEVARNYEVRGLTKYGKYIDLEMNAHIIEWNNRLAVQSSFRDITERKMLEREQSIWLWEQETLSDIDRKLAGVMDLEKIFSAILQQTLNLTRANFAGVLLYDEKHIQVQWKAICGNMYQHSLGAFFPADFLKNILSKREPTIINETQQDKGVLYSRLPVISEENLVSTIWLPLVVKGEEKGALVVGYRHSHEFAGREIRLLNSIAEKHSIAMVNAQLYESLLEREKELEMLSGARVKAQEEERRRIAREIHDGLGQMLTAIKFNIEILEDAMILEKDKSERLKDIKKLLDEVMKEAREISYNLMPSILEDFGLIPALQLLSDQFSNRTNIKVNFLTHGLVERLDSQIEISLYRIVQEALNNVAKHAEASEVNLQVLKKANSIRLVIEDNGKGIDISNRIRISDKGGMGLISMRERARSLGGTFTIDSIPKNGTLIIVEIPLTGTNLYGKN